MPTAGSSSGAATLARLLPQLHKAFEVGHRDGKYAASMALCHKVLAVDAQHVGALDVLLFCLIQSELYADALKTAARVTHRSTALERAYAAYCTQRFAEAVRIIDEASAEAGGATAPGSAAARSLLRLKAQAQYRIGDFAASATSYSDLCAAAGGDGASAASAARDAELYVNALATFLSGGDLDAVEALRPKLAGLDNSELAFNLGTALLHRADAGAGADANNCTQALRAAEAQLTRARDLCVASCERYLYSVADTANELAPILVQLAYTWQRLGRTAEAKATYLRVLAGKPTDVVVVAVASNNLLALWRPDEAAGGAGGNTLGADQSSSSSAGGVFDALKRSKVALGLGRHLSPAQLRAVSLNDCIVQLHAKNTKACERKLQSLSERSADDERYALVRAAHLLRSGKGHKANEALRGFAELHPGAASVRARLQLAQQLLLSHKAPAAVEQLAAATEHDADLRHSLGFVSAVVSIHESLGDGDAALAALRDAIAHWSAKGSDAPRAAVARVLNALRSASAKLQSQLGHADAAAAELQALADGIDAATATAASADAAARHRADLVVALSYVDPQLAAQLAAAPDFAKAAAVDTAAVDVDAVLASFLTYQPRAKGGSAASPTKGGGAAKAAEAAEAAAMAARRAATLTKRRMKRRAKQRAEFVEKLKAEGRYNANAQPDPERWLPRRLRKRAGGRRRGRGAGGGAAKGGAQGAGDVSGRDADKYDVAAQVQAGTLDAGKANSTARKAASGSSAQKKKNKNKRGGKKKKK